MNEKTKRILFFFLCCVPLRTLIGIISKNINIDKLIFYIPFTILTLIIGFNFTYIYLFGHFKDDSLGFFKGPMWWDDLRIIHGLLYLSYSIINIVSLIRKNNNKYSHLILFADLIIGIISFISVYF